MVTEVKQWNFLDLNVEIAEPLINIFLVFLLDVLEFICVEVDVTIENGHFELASIDLELSINDGEGAPTHHDILRHILLRAQVHYLKHDDI